MIAERRSVGWILLLILFAHFHGIAAGWFIWDVGSDAVVTDVWMGLGWLLFCAGSWITYGNLFALAFPGEDRRPYAGGPFMWFFVGYRFIWAHVLPPIERLTGCPFWLLNLTVLAAFVVWMTWSVIRAFPLTSLDNDD